MADKQVLDVAAREARLRVSHLGSLELVQALAEAYSHYIFAPYVSPQPQVCSDLHTCCFHVRLPWPA